LIGEKPAEVTRTLNEIVGLSVLDRLFGNLNKRLYALRTNLKYEEKGIDADKEEIERLTPYRKLSKLYEELSLTLSSYEELKGYIDQLNTLLQNIAVIKQKQSFLNKSISLEEDVQRLIENVKVFQQLKTKIDTLDRLILAFNLFQERKNRAAKLIRLTIPVTKLSNAISQYNQGKTQAERLQRELIQLQRQEELAEKAEETKLVLLSDYEKLLAELKVCPTCFSPITKEKAHTIVEDMK
jgi:exonuclease SbcC